MNFVYGYDKFGNLAAREDNINNVEETFTYDDIDRLTGVTLNGVLHSEIRYDNAGRMVMKQMDGRTVFNEASFSNAKPHAMVKATTARSVFPEDDQTIDYTSFDKVRRIVQGDNTITYTYGIDNQRVTMTEVAGGDRISKVYVGNCEFIKDNGVEKVRTYLTGPYGLFAVVEKAGGEEAIHYIYADHLGSWTTITDSVGNVEQRQSFDAWGRRRDPQTLSYDNVTVSFDRGYTMHEHYDAFGLINMNGRVYDPLVGRMLSPDILIQDPELSQAYNRYSYCLNNPLRFTDPSGYVTTIPPEFEKYYYPDLIGDYESYKEKLTEQGAENVSYNTESSEGKETTTLSWTVEGNKYQMEIVNHRLSGYGETCKNSCVADAFSAQEARFEYGNKELTPEEIMSWEENSCEHGLKASDIITLFLKQSEVYSNNGYTYTDMNDISGISYYEKRAYFEMDKNRGVFFNFSPSEFENGHVVNASTAIQFSIDNQVKAHEIRIWDSGNDNGKPGGYRSLLFYDLNKLFGKYGAFDK